MEKYQFKNFYTILFKNTSKRLRQKQINKKLGVKALEEIPTITGNALDLEPSYNVLANQENTNLNRNLKKNYDTGHDKYKHRKSVENPEDKNNKE